MKFQHQLQKDPLGWCIVVVLALVIVFALTRHVRSRSWYDLNASCASSYGNCIVRFLLR
jgi:hypothetical protein